VAVDEEGSERAGWIVLTRICMQLASVTAEIIKSIGNGITSAAKPVWQCRLYDIQQ